MKDLISLVEICKSDLDSLGIKYGKVSNWTVNTRAKCRLGQCRIITSSLFDINISEALLKEDVDNQITLNTIMYELLHTVPGCFTHKGKWKLYADYVNKKLPQYTIKRVSKESEVNITIDRKQPVYKYILRCSKCGQEVKRQKETKVITNHKRYRCGDCGGRLERII